MSRARTKTIQQKNIIPSLNRFLKDMFKSTGIMLDNDGICAGLTALYLINKARGTSHKFFFDLQKIATLKKSDYQKEASWIAEYCREIKFAFEPMLFKKDIQQGDLDKIFNKRGAKIIRNDAMGGRVKVESLADILREIKPEEMTYVQINQHAVGIYYSSGIYSYYDPNNEKELNFEDVTALSASLLETFVKPGQRSVKVALKKFSYREEEDYTINEFKKFERAELINKISQEDDPQFTHSLYFSCLVNDTEMVELLLSNGVNPFAEIDVSSSAFNLACTFGQQTNTLAMLGTNFYISATETEKSNILQHGIFYAIDKGFPHLARVLWERAMKDLSDKEYPLFVEKTIKMSFIKACSNHKPESLMLLLEKSPYQIITDTLRKEGLIAAVRANSANVVRFLVDYYPNLISKMVNSKESLSWLLQESIAHDAYTTFIELSEIIADHVNVNDVHLNQAIRYNRPRIIEEILKRGVKLTMNHIRTAAKLHDWELLKKLIKAEIFFHGKDKLELMQLKKVIYSDEAVRTEFITNSRDQDFKSDIYLAAINNREVACIALFESMGVKITSHGSLYEYFINACEDGDIQKLGYFISAGIKMHEVFSKVELASIVNIAYENKDEDLLLFLLKQGCQLNFIKIARQAQLEFFETCAKDRLIPPNVFKTKEDAGKWVKLAVEKGSLRALESILIINQAQDNDKQIPQHVLDQLLIEMCVKQNPGKADLLISYGARLSDNDYIKLFNLAYKEEHFTEGEKNDYPNLTILRSAYLNNHQAIYNFILDKKLYLKELEKNPRPYRDLKLLLLLDPSLIKPSKVKGHFLRQLHAPDLKKAILLGDLKLIELLCNKKVDPRSQNYNPLELAAVCGHIDVVKFLRTNYYPKKEEIENLILTATVNKSYTMIATLLESLPRQYLSEEVKMQLLSHRYDIREAYYYKVLFKITQKDEPREDAQERQAAVARDENCLGEFLHMTQSGNNYSPKF